MASIIEVEKLSKCYRLGQFGARTFAEDLKRLGKRMLGKDDRHLDELTGADAQAAGRGTFWALRDISFNVRQGEVLGVIGANGAGKSTLLKILSRITEPTDGRAVLKGRVASLLEVGTGMNPELTGRENVYLNGTILGLRKWEIDQRLDEIVEFAGVAKFMETPVKRYSSGMRVRLGFAVAAHLEPEILIVDEVLAVGDAAFQEKCMGKMKDVSGKGKTVLFVSHNMQFIKHICDRCILLKDGRLVEEGASDKLVESYLYNLNASGSLDATSSLGDARLRRGHGQARFGHIEMLDTDNKSAYSFERGRTVRIKAQIEINEKLKGLKAGLILKSEVHKEVLVHFMRELSDQELGEGQRVELVLEFPTDALRAGSYPTYFYLQDSEGANCDIVDGVTAPVIVTEAGAEAVSHYIDIEPSRVDFAMVNKKASS